MVGVKIVVNEAGDRFWFTHDKIHRVGGPAIELANGEKRWFLDEYELTESEYEERMIAKAYENAANTERLRSEHLESWRYKGKVC